MLPRGFDGTLRGLSQEELELGEDLLDRFPVGAVGWQLEQLGACCSDRISHGAAFVAAEVHDDDVAGREGENEELLDISREELAVDRPIEHTGCVDAVAARRRHEGQRLPLAERSLGDELAATLRPASDRRHVGLGPGLVDEDQPARIKPALILLPLRPAPRDLRTVLLGGEQPFS